MTGDPRPPLGTVTCLFSDIEGSTRIELAVGPAVYRDIRERHRALLRGAFAAHDGYEQSTEGDSFFVLFRRAIDAIGAAVAAQRALAAETWPDGVEVRVRMGLHTGEIDAVGDDVIGYDINRCARIAAAAHGGQVLLSSATRGLLAEGLGDGVSILDLGLHRLKDLREPEHLAQLIIEGLPDAFPPIRSLDARPSNLPTQLTTFVGRETELAEARELLGRTRLLTLTGPGGTGKTRLSLQIAAGAADDFPNGVWFVALDAVRDPTLVIPTIARTLGVGDSKATTTIDRLTGEIGDGRVLLVLDNFEQVTEAAPDVAHLLRTCPNLTCIVTTRIPLRISGEQEYPVPGLPAPPDTARLSEVERLNLPKALRELDPEALARFEAVRLFVARASAVRPDFALTGSNARAVAGIAARLHGMPLAIELAAARIKLLTPERILDRLEDHLALLTGGSRDLPERQQTLRGAIAWSYELLDEGAQRLVDRLSVFRGGFDLDMAAAVCGPPEEVGGDVADRLGELIDQSLVRVDDDGRETRFAMLETIREYAGEMLAARGETEQLAARHAAAMLAFAQRASVELSGPDQRTWGDHLEHEHDNMRAALDWATARPDPVLATRLAFALWRFWQQRGYLNEARARFDAMAAKGWDLDPVDRARFAEAAGGIAYWQSDQPSATGWYQEALDIWRKLGDKAEIANALYNRAYADLSHVMGGTARSERGLEPGRAMLEEALALYRELGDVRGEANVIWGLGSVFYFTAAAADAETSYRRSLELHRTVGDRTMEAWSLHMLALSLAGQQRWQEARTRANEALQRFHEQGDVSGVTLVLDDLAIIDTGVDDLDRATRLWGAARQLQRTTGTALADYVEQTNTLFGVPTPADVLPPDELAARSAEGAAMTLDEIVTYALDADERSSGSPPGSPPATDVEVAS